MVCGVGKEFFPSRFGSDEAGQTLIPRKPQQSQLSSEDRSRLPAMHQQYRWRDVLSIVMIISPAFRLTIA